MTKAIESGRLEFNLIDDREMKGNQSVELTYRLYTNGEYDELLPIENFYAYCKYFAAAMGYGKETINDWFGE